MVTVEHIPVKNLERQRVLDKLLDRALQGTGTESRVVALVEEQFFGGVGQLDRDFAVGQETAKVFEAQIDNLDQLLLAERTEHDHVVDTVQELGFEMSMQGIHDLLTGVLKGFGCADIVGLQKSGADV